MTFKSSFNETRNFGNEISISMQPGNQVKYVSAADISKLANNGVKCAPSLLKFPYVA